MFLIKFFIFIYNPFLIKILYPIKMVQITTIPKNNVHKILFIKPLSSLFFLHSILVNKDEIVQKINIMRTALSRGKISNSPNIANKIILNDIIILTAFIINYIS